MKISISDEHFIGLKNTPCYYCGNHDPNRCSTINQKDPSIGYTVKNCLPICSSCKTSKKDFSVEYFIAYRAAYQEAKAELDAEKEERGMVSMPVTSPENVNAELRLSLQTIESLLNLAKGIVMGSE